MLHVEYKLEGQNEERKKNIVIFYRHKKTLFVITNNLSSSKTNFLLYCNTSNYIIMTINVRF